MAQSDHAKDALDDLRRAADPRDPRADGLLKPPGSAPDGWAIVGLPYDGGAPRSGARFGPAAFRNALRAFTPFDGERALPDVEDYGDLDLPSMNGAMSHGNIGQAAQRLFAAGRKCLFIGGDHSCTGSIVRGLADARPDLRLALISIDAHLDVREYDDAANLSSGTPIRRALETPIADGRRTAIVGLRPFANAAYYTEWAQARGIRLIGVDEVARRGAERVMVDMVEAVTAVADGVYLTIDVDAVDAAYAPGVSAPAVGGLSVADAILLVRAVAKRSRLVGADLMELSPPYDRDAVTARLGARLCLEVLGPVS